MVYANERLDKRGEIESSSKADFDEGEKSKLA